MRSPPARRSICSRSRHRALARERESGRSIAVSVATDPFPQLQRRLEQHGAELIRGDRRTPFDRVFFRDSDGSILEVVAAERTPATSACRFSLDSRAAREKGRLPALLAAAPALGNAHPRHVTCK